MGLFNMFKKAPTSKAMSLEYKKAIKNPYLFSNYMKFSAVFGAFNVILHDKSLFMESGLSRLEYYQLAEKLLKAYGRRYVFNWYKMKEEIELEKNKIIKDTIFY